MIDIYIKASHEFFKKNKVEEFQVNIDEVSVAMHSEDELLVLTMQGEVERKIIERLCADILSIIFIYLGAYPRIVSREIQFMGLYVKGIYGYVSNR